MAIVVYDSYEIYWTRIRTRGPTRKELGHRPGSSISIGFHFNLPYLEALPLLII